jgi:hypothetical protein
MTGPEPSLGLLTQMLTPAVLISACGTLILSTSMRLARIVDRVRQLGEMSEQLASGQVRDFLEERVVEVQRQLAVHARRAGLIQWSLTSFYVSLCLLVATMVGIGLTGFVPRLVWLPTVVGVLGSVVLFYGSVMLIGETRLALKSVLTEMEFATRLGGRRMKEKVP